jgi:signal recognition particle receptor subunit beta
MAEIDQRNRTIRVKIVYYGPPLGGKTTNLLRLHARAVEAQRGEMISINSRQDRTILFDLLPLTAVGPRGFELRFQVVAVPGQALYSATRRAALRGADGVVFVANSAADRWQESVTSYNEMKKHLVDHGIDPTAVPFALQYNKRDLPLVTEVGAMDLGLRMGPDPAVLAVATRGEGVIETFEAILARTMRDLSRRFRVLAVEDGPTPEQFARQTVTSLFGRVSPAAGEEDRPRTTIRVAVPGADGDGGAGLARSPGAVAEAYAEACDELAGRLSTVTAERDEAQAGLADVRRALAIAADLDRRDLAMTVKRMLACLAESVGAARASFAFVNAGGFGHAVALPGAADLLLDSAGGRRYLQALVQADGPCLQEAACDLELWALLGGGERNLSALLSLPLRTSTRTIGLAVLCFLEDDPLPSPAALERLELVASVFAAPLAMAAPEKGAEGGETTEAPDSVLAVAS